MATIHREFDVAVPASFAWDAAKATGEVHTRLAAGFVTGTVLEGDVRTVTFANGFVVKERIVTVDDGLQRLAYTSVGGRASHHNASIQVIARGARNCRIAWTTDLLPDDMEAPIAQMVDAGCAAMKATLETGFARDHGASVGSTSTPSTHAPMFQLDAFTSRRFGGNPAAVVLLDRFPDPAVMQAIAAENNLAETAFLVREGADYRLRWFTPLVEVPLCGHATLASAAVVMERLEPSRERVVFQSASGPLTVTRAGGGYVMDFPVRRSETVPAPAGLAQALGAGPLQVTVNAFNYLAELESVSVVRELQPDFRALAGIGRSGVIVTAAGEGDYDFTSRYFAPAKGVDEDPVTGGAHCMLVPYWAGKLGRSAFRAYQASRRGGEMKCRLAGDRVELEGECVFYLEGRVEF